MKLVQKISRYFLIGSVLVFVFVGILLYVIIEQTIINEIDEQLISVSKKAVKELQKGKEISFPPLLEISEVQNQMPEPVFKNILLKSSEENDLEPFREYSLIVVSNGKQYKVTVRMSLIEKEDMFLSIFGVSLGAVLILLLILFLINKVNSNKIFADFYRTLSQLENFSVSQNINMVLGKSSIEEFETLNKAVIKLAEKARSEYLSLKGFTEETNHEIQTPLAVIKSKLEILLQSNRLGDEDLQLVNTTLQNLNKLERINKSILLLNKLEHKNLFESSTVNLTEEVKNVISMYSDFINAKKLSTEISLNKEIVFEADPSLMNILFSNLISNAIKHNITGGSLNIKLDEDELTIVNSRIKDKVVPAESPDNLGSDYEIKGSSGLGLKIAQKICRFYGIKMSNEFKNMLHTTKLIFNKLN